MKALIFGYLLLFSASTVLAQSTEPMSPIDIQEWAVPYDNGRPRDPYAVSDDAVWFVGQRTSYLARFRPQSGEFVRRDLEDNPGPHNLIVGSDGIVWYAGNRKGYIGRYDPETGEIEKIAMPDEAARDPHTLIFDEDESHIWFTVQGGNFVGRLNIMDRVVDLIPVPTKRARPYGIHMAPDGTVWVALFGTNKLASIDPDEFRLSEHVLPSENARPRRLAVSSDGHVYYGDYARGTIARFNPADGTVDEWTLPSGENARPYGLAIDAQDRVWLVETGPSPNNFVGFDTVDEKFFSVTPIPSGAGAVRHMHFYGPTNSIWFGTDANTIGRAKIGP